MTTKSTPPKIQARTGESGNVIEELRRRYDRLTQSQKRIAEYIVEQSQAVAFSTVDQMAAELDVNPSTIVRFCYRLGLNGFPDLQERMRQVVRGQLSRAGEPVEANAGAFHLQGTSFGASLSHDLQNLHRTMMGLSLDDLNRAVDQIISARRVYVIAGYSSYSVAHYFGLVVSRLRGDVFTIMTDEGHSSVRIAEIAAQDCLVAFTFPRYAVLTQRVATWAREMKATIVAITDTPISAVGQIANTVLLTASAGPGMQNSMIGPMAVANALLNGITAAQGTSALDRYGRSDSLLNKWNAFLLELDEPD
jgi:DNA-binding MurR/RpiR family transcriptional regulator